MTAEEDARKRYEDWVAAGAPDYNVVNQPGYQAPAAPAAPAPIGGALVNAGGLIGAIQPKPSTGGALVNAGGLISTTRTSAPAAPTASSGDFDYPVAPAAAAPAAPAAPAAATGPPAPGSAGTVTMVNPVTGGIETVNVEDLEQTREAYRRLVEEQARRQAETERARQYQLDTERISAEGQKAYQQALIQYQNSALAQQAADNAMRNEIERQRNIMTASYQQGQLAMQGAAQQGEQQYRNQLIALQQQNANQERRRRRPYRALRVSVD